LLGRGGGEAYLLQGCGEFPAGADLELGEYLREVVLDRPGADEKLRRDLGIGAVLAG
jgi:hypothetical protein